MNPRKRRRLRRQRTVRKWLSGQGKSLLIGWLTDVSPPVCIRVPPNFGDGPKRKKAA